MANSLLTPTKVTRQALMILHQKLNFIGRVNRGYDDSFAQDGAKIGDTLRIRLPNEYEVTDGRVMNVQDTSENYVSLQVNNQKHVAMNFTARDLTLDIDDFSERIIEPAMARLAAKVESDVLTNVYKEVYQQVNNVGSACTFNNVVTARKKLVDALAPIDVGGRNASFSMATQTNVDLVDSLKALFNDQKEISRQYLEGLIGRGGGFSFYENTHMPNHTSGTDASAHTVNGAGQTGSTVTVATGSGTFKKGDIVTFAGSFRVHPETKAASGQLMQFVVTADYAGGAGSLAVSPAITTSGARQNVTASPTNGGAVTKVGGNAATYDVNLAFHKDAFTFATADLTMPKNAHFAARETLDGLSLRVWQADDIINDAFPCRVDILYGYKTIRPELACRVATNS